MKGRKLTSWTSSKFKTLTQEKAVSSDNEKQSYALRENACESQSQNIDSICKVNRKRNKPN
jgi:hypothetical protein